MWFCYDCGLRISEVLHLKLTDIDYKNSLIKIKDSKNNKSRYAKLSDTTKKYLLNWLPLRKLKKSKFIFPGTSFERPLYYANIQAEFHEAVKNSKISGKVTLHTLRHAYVSMLFEEGVQPSTIQNVLGHSSITTTMNYIVQIPKFMTKLPSHLSHKR